MLMTAGLTRSATFENEPVVSGICTGRMGASTSGAATGRTTRSAPPAAKAPRATPATTASTNMTRSVLCLSCIMRASPMIPPPAHDGGARPRGFHSLELAGSRHGHRLLGRQDSTHALVGWVGGFGDFG